MDHQDGWFVDLRGNLRDPYGTYVHERSDTTWVEIELQIHRSLAAFQDTPSR